ncbi:hypothetical protein A8C75_16275 [Marinobacterium aestuarii]|uniref:DUF1468 domain-containing protein n=1 Tax=Marinobacterium aestuarii TaxID=1821621 RepID=A0A1A9F291_9GAMM|nr:tripartite tricarboxylate transporter TctB family protein [Marinobacterium aestuarii]ANG63879.1 hypothetical protein A8C75_16275 [Marinobacterium aestuarii]
MKATNEPATSAPLSPPPGWLNLGAGLFFLAWALLGWLSLLGTPELTATLGKGPDPGPALLPVVVLTLLSVGGLAIVGHSLYRSYGRFGPCLVAWHRHRLAVALIASLAALPSLMSWIGFAAAVFLTLFSWIWALGLKQSQPGWRIALIALLSSAVITGAFYAGFVVLIRVPFPGL